MNASLTSCHNLCFSWRFSGGLGLLHWFPFIILVTKRFKSLFFLCVLETRKIKTHKNYAFLWCSLSTLKTRNSCYPADGRQPRSRICWTCRSFVARLWRGLGLSTRLDKPAGKGQINWMMSLNSRGRCRARIVGDIQPVNPK